MSIKPFQHPAPHISRADVPLHRLEADLRAFLALKQAATTAGVAAETRHLMDPLDHDFERLAVTHPDLCSANADYPTFHPGGGA